MRNILPALLVLTIACNSCKEESNNPAAVNDVPTKVDSPIKVLPPPVTHYTPPDHSPMDMIYFPKDYPFLKMTGETEALPLMRVIYSRPQKEKRKIFDGLVQYDMPWRLGANESTEVEFFSTATIQGKKIKPGRYVLYCIPQETKWTFVFNSNLYSWGLKQNRKKDVMQFDSPIEKLNTSIEYFTIATERITDKSTDLIFLWDDVKTKLTISF